MNKDECYEKLADKFLTYKEMAAKAVEDNGDPMIPIGSEFEGKLSVMENYKPYTGDDIYVRSQLIPMLIQAQKELQAINPDYDLEIFCGYRPMDIQEENFAHIRKLVLEEDPTLEGDALKEKIHRFSAAPEVAGHPTGGAVDVQISTPHGALDMGTPIHSYSKDTYTFSPFIHREAWHNRQILRACMVKAGFAPFDGEWWHFSYGDREWAAYYNKPNALFDQLRFKVGE